MKFAIHLLYWISLCLLPINTLADTNPPKPAVNSNDQPMVLYQEALSYLLGQHGKPKSAEKAAELFKTLAEQNWRSAQHMLGNLYYQGKGVEKNDLLAYKWLSIAARNNSELAEVIYNKRKKLQNQLTEDHLKQVEQWIDEWQPSLALSKQ